MTHGSPWIKTFTLRDSINLFESIVTSKYQSEGGGPTDTTSHLTSSSPSSFRLFFGKKYPHNLVTKQTKSHFPLFSCWGQEWSSLEWSSLRPTFWHFYGHLPLLGRCHLFSTLRQQGTTTYCTHMTAYSVVPFGLTLSIWLIWGKEVRINDMIFIWLHHVGSSRPQVRVSLTSLWSLL